MPKAMASGMSRKHPSPFPPNDHKGPTDIYLAAVLVDTVELAASTIVFLTQKRQEWLAGRYISVNWDMEELFRKKDEIVEKDLLKVRMAIE